MVSDQEHEQLSSKLQKVVVGPTKRAMALPKDIQFFRTLDKDFSEDLDMCNSRLLSIMSNLLNFVDKATPKGKGKERLESLDDLLLGFNPFIVSRLDKMFENAVSPLLLLTLAFNSASY